MKYIWIWYNGVKTNIGVSILSPCINLGQWLKFFLITFLFSVIFFLFNNNAASLKLETFTPCCCKHCYLKPVFLAS